MARNNYDNMTKEELLKAMKKKNATYKWQKACVLTPTEGARLETDILPQYDCKNISQLVKKIVNGEIILTKAN